MTDLGDTGGRDGSVEGRLDDLDRRQEKAVRAIKLLVDKVDSLGRILTRLSDGVAARPAGHSDTQRAPIESDDLANWVSWLIAHYELSGIPACWPRHGGLVAEFDALRGAWVESVGQGPGGMAAVQWHDALGRFVARVHDPRMGRFGHCLDFGHKDPPGPPTPDGDPTERTAPTDQPATPNASAPSQ
jgi:hypothetical protein